MKKELKEGQGFICETLEEKKRIWQKLTDAGYPMTTTWCESLAKDIMGIKWRGNCFGSESPNQITHPLNESDFFDDLTPKAGEWVEGSQNGKDWDEVIYLFTLGQFHMVSLFPLDYGKGGNFAPVKHIRQIKPETMTLQEVRDKLRDDVGSPFTEQESKIMQLIVEAHNEFVNLERGHSMEIQEWVSGIHKLQSILSHRCLRRLFPSHFC
jgi:hypothetical protein